MAEKRLKFLVVFFSKNRRLFIALAAVLAIIAVAGAIATFSGWVGSGKKGESLAWRVVLQEADWQGVPTDASLPKYFVAAGLAFDRQTLVEGWGLPEDILKPVDYLQDIGLHILMGEVVRVQYSPHRLEIYIDEKDTGYQLVTISKGDLNEGDLQIVYLNSAGGKLGYDEEFVHSVPLKYTLVEEGALDTKGGVFIEILDAETLPTLTEHNPSFLNQYAGALLLYIHGAKVNTIQRNEATLRIYTEPVPGFQIVAVETNLLQLGNNTVRMIDSASLQMIAELLYLVAK